MSENVSNGKSSQDNTPDTKNVSVIKLNKLEIAHIAEQKQAIQDIKIKIADSVLGIVREMQGVNGLANAAMQIDAELFKKIQGMAPSKGIDLKSEDPNNKWSFDFNEMAFKRPEGANPSIKTEEKKSDDKKTEVKTEAVAELPKEENKKEEEAVVQ